MTREEKFNDYAGFVEKFKPKKTTDDCYTPPMVYEDVLTHWMISLHAKLFAVLLRMSLAIPSDMLPPPIEAGASCSTAPTD